MKKYRVSATSVLVCFATFGLQVGVGDIYIICRYQTNALTGLKNMADMKGSGVVCDQSCGCPSPCPGGTACSCTGGGSESSTMDHKKCSCGEHCGCNPCTCTKITGTGTGGGSDGSTVDHKKCLCGEHCGCNPCTCAA